MVIAQDLKSCSLGIVSSNLAHVDFCSRGECCGEAEVWAVIMGESKDEVSPRTEMRGEVWLYIAGEEIPYVFI